MLGWMVQFRFLERCDLCSASELNCVQYDGEQAQLRLPSKKQKWNLSLQNSLPAIVLPIQILLTQLNTSIMQFYSRTVPPVQSLDLGTEPEVGGDFKNETCLLVDTVALNIKSYFLGKQTVKFLSSFLSWWLIPSIISLAPRDFVGPLPACLYLWWWTCYG